MNVALILRQTVLMMIVLTAITGILYPLGITAVAQLCWPHRANGSLIRTEKGEVVGSELLGQEFTRADYFWSRPSATSPAYNAGASSGSNLGPLNPNLKKNVGDRLKALQSLDTQQKLTPPIDLVTASGSGLDPHISLAAARYQAERVAKARGISREKIDNLIEQATDSPQFGMLGMTRVNVLKLNRSLDKVEAK